MLTVTVTKTVYKFEELSDRAKERAFDWYLSNCVLAEDLKMVLDGLLDTLKDIGFSIDPKKLWWQLDRGACVGLNGDFYYVKGAIAKARKDHPKIFVDDKGITHECKGNILLHGVLDQIQDLCRRNFYNLSFHFKGDDRRGTWLTNAFVGGNYASDDLESEVKSLIQDLEYLFLSTLQEEERYLCSEECMQETCEANEWHFYEDGSFYG